MYQQLRKVLPSCYGKRHHTPTHADIFRHCITGPIQAPGSCLASALALVFADVPHVYAVPSVGQYLLAEARTALCRDNEQTSGQCLTLTSTSYQGCRKTYGTPYCHKFRFPKGEAGVLSEMAWPPLRSTLALITALRKLKRCPSAHVEVRSRVWLAGLL